MSREWVGETRSQGWVMRCDNWRGLCKTEVGPRRTEHDLPLREFIAAGWFIARTHGDRCPKCVAAAGGIVALCRAAAAKGGPGAPHDLMPRFPERIRRRREKGWRMPEGAVYVGRGSKWGNPFRLRTPYALMRYPGAEDPTAAAEYEGRISADGARHDYFHPGGKITFCHVRYMTPAESVEHYELALRQTPTPAMASSGVRHLYHHTGKPFPNHIEVVTVEDVRAELAGKPLACWCDLDQPCHADVLLAIANTPAPAEVAA